MRQRQIQTLSGIVFLCFFIYSISRVVHDAAEQAIHEKPPPPVPPKPKEPVQWEDPPLLKGGSKPKKMQNTATHPIWYLMEEEQKKFEAVQKRQSKTLDEAVKEYRKRYNLPPPPHFDKWFEFAQENKVELVDEFDTVHDLITPFWGLKPGTIRSRAKEALGYDNGLIGVSIRNHEVTSIHGGLEWQQKTTMMMMEKFLQYLPDMDLAFNLHDESRVMVPHEDMVRLIDTAKKENMPALDKYPMPVNDFTPTAPELGDGLVFEETKLTRFNEFPHQATWTHSRMSCPPESPARKLEEDERTDDVSKYSATELGFIYNVTAQSDICLTPSLSSTYGFFDRPNAYKVVHDLFPIFSASKISTYSDLIYPSPWYWWGHTPYDESKDMAWSKKENKLYWRGSTTGGFSREGGWRRQHRQRFVKKINGHDQAKIFVNAGGQQEDGGAGTPDWKVTQLPRGEFKDLIDVHFAHVGQCDPGDCEAQIEFFDVVDFVELFDAYRNKYLLDMDGNALSGRFYAFLLSQSMVYKLTIFREWHNERLKPWVHYVPLSLQGDEWLEAVRFFDDPQLGGEKEAQKMATASREWANKSVRRIDMEAWFFRLLLEYARVIDENRAILGYDPASASKKLDPSLTKQPDVEEQGPQEKLMGV